MKNLIFSALATRDAQCYAVNLNKKNAFDNYIKNAYVALKSAKLNNPNDDVALVINFELSEYYKKLFEEARIKWIYCEFNEFCVPERFPWALAFFKLCALKHMVTNYDYEHCLLLDTDTITVSAYSELWEEVCTGQLMLYNVNLPYNSEVRSAIRKDNEKLFGRMENIQHYGGEFVCGSRESLARLVQNCAKVFSVIEQEGFQIDRLSGDELILSIAVKEEKILSAEAYIFRFWTGREYIVNTRYQYNPLCIWHIPSEKNSGFLKVYDYLVKRGVLPPRLYTYFGLKKPRRRRYFKYIITKYLSK